MAAFWTDSITGTDGVNLNTLSGWSKHPASGSRALLLSSNRCYADVNSGAALYINTAAPPSPDYVVHATIRVRSSESCNIGVCGRMDASAATFYHARYNTGTASWELYRFNSGTATEAPTRSAHTLTVGNDYDVELRMVGSVIELWLTGEGSARISWTDSSPITATGKIGVRCSTGNSSTTGMHIDTIDASDLAAAGAIQGAATSVAAATGALTVPPPSTTWYDHAWERRKALNVPAGKVSSTVTDLPLLIRVDDDAVLGALAQRSGADIVLTDASGTKLAHELIDYWAGLEREAGWVWFVRPSALHYVGTHDRTWVSYQKNDGAITIAQYDHTNAAWSPPFNLHAPGDSTNLFVQEDHGPASILVRASDKRLMTFYAGHAGPDIFMRISSAAEDASAWSSEVNLDAQFGGNGYSYPNPIQFADGTIWVIYRATAPNDGSPTDWFYSQSSDDGATWSAGTKFWDNSGYGYLSVAQNGDTLYFVANPDHPRWLTTNSTYTFKYVKGAGWQAMDGTSITLPAAPGNTTLLYSGASADGRSWLWDIAVGGDGYPRVLYARLGDTDHHKIRWARWTGSAWDDHLVCDSGADIGSRNPDNANYDDPWYSGGAGFNHSDPNTIYVAQKVSGVHEIYRHVTADNGSSFTPTAITTNSKHNNFRPICPRNAHADLELFWRYGPMPDYTRHLTGIVMHPLTAPRVQELTLRARVPSLSASANNWLWLYYNNPAASAQENRAGTYASTWRMVWNGREGYSTAPNTITDSTGSVTLTKSANQRPYEKKGAQVRGSYFDGSDRVDGALNMAGWAEVTVLSHVSWDGTPTGDEHQIFANWSADKAGVILRIDPTASNQIEAFARVGTDVQVGGTSTLAVTAAQPTTVAMQYRSSDGILCRRNKTTAAISGSSGNGALDASASANLAIGRYNTDFIASPGSDASGEFFSGWMGAVWVADSYLSAAFLDAWSDNIAAPQSFVEAGSTQAGAIPLAGAAAASATADGQILTDIKLSASALSSAQAAVGMTTAIKLAGVAVSSVTATASFASDVALAGVATAQVGATGDLTTQIPMASSALGLGTAAGALTTQIVFSGAALAQAMATASLPGTAAQLFGDAVAVAVADGSMTTAIPLSGVAASVSLADGMLTISVLLSGAALARATASADLSGGTPAALFVNGVRNVWHAPRRDMVWH